MSSSNCCFLTCIQISQEAGQVVWYSHLFQNFPQFVVIHTVKGFGVVNKAEVDVFFCNHLAFLMIQWMLRIWSLVPLPFLNPAWTSGSSRFTYCWSLPWKISTVDHNTDTMDKLCSESDVTDIFKLSNNSLLVVFSFLYVLDRKVNPTQVRRLRLT